MPAAADPDTKNWIRRDRRRANAVRKELREDTLHFLPLRTEGQPWRRAGSLPWLPCKAARTLHNGPLTPN